MAAKLTRLTHKIAIQLHLVAESCSRRPVRKLLDTRPYIGSATSFTPIKSEAETSARHYRDLHTFLCAPYTKCTQWTKREVSFHIHVYIRNY